MPIITLWIGCPIFSVNFYSLLFGKGDLHHEEKSDNTSLRINVEAIFLTVYHVFIFQSIKKCCDADSKNDVHCYSCEQKALPKIKWPSTELPICNIYRVDKIKIG